MSHLTPPRAAPRRNTAPALSPRVPSTSSHPLAISIPGASTQRETSIYARLARTLSRASVPESSDGLLSSSVHREEEGGEEAQQNSSWAVVGAWQGRASMGGVGIEGSVSDAVSSDGGLGRQGKRQSVGPDDGSMSFVSDEDNGTIVEVEEEEESEDGQEEDQLILPRRVSQAGRVDDEDEDQYATAPRGPTPFPSMDVRNVIKCTTAYIFAELFTFMPALSALIAMPLAKDQLLNAHLVATVAVFLNPAKSVGSMVEANLFLLLGLAYALFLCFTSLGITVFLHGYGLENVAHCLILIVWIGGGFGLLVYVKAKIDKPPLATACSLVGIIASVVITREGAYHLGEFDTEAILQLILIVVIGSSISNLVCLILWPGSATSQLQLELNRTWASYSLLVGMLSKTFLLEDDINTSPSEFNSAIKAHQSSFTTLKSSLSQAKYEFYDHRIKYMVNHYDNAVEIMTRLAQLLTSMRAGCTLSRAIITARLEEENEEDDLKKDKLRNERAMLVAFEGMVGDSLRNVTRTSQKSLTTLQQVFSHPQVGLRRAGVSEDPEAGLPSSRLLVIKAELDQSLARFKESHSLAVRVLYQSASPGQTDPFLDNPDAGDDGGATDNLFRLYYFCFNLEEWVRELSRLVGTCCDIQRVEDELRQMRKEDWRRWGIFSRLVRLFHSSERSLKPSYWNISTARLIFRLMFTTSQPNPFPIIVDGALTSHRTAFASSFIGQLKERVWRFGHALRNPEIRFAIKTGAGAALLATLAFVPKFRPTYVAWRLEWSLISYMVVASPVIGNSNLLAFQRVLGTGLGGAVAVLFYTTFTGDPVILTCLGALVSVPCFYVIVTSLASAPSARFALITYNLTCLFAYNVGGKIIMALAFHRSVAVAVGVLWSLAVMSYVFPFEARRELRKGLSEFLLNVAYFYENIVRTYSTPPRSTAPRESTDEPTTEITAFLPSETQDYLSSAVRDFATMESYLQLSLVKLSALLAATKHEPRLKGPFPVDSYRLVLGRCQNILDILTSMRTVTARESWYTFVRKDFVIPVNKERREMVGSVLLYLCLLASALSLKAPLPAFLPPAAEARKRLVSKLRSLEVVRRRIVVGGTSESLLYLAYALTMEEIIADLDSLGKVFQQLFGIVGGVESTEEFERLFVTRPEDDVLLAASS